MAYDAINLSILCEELQETLINGKITKIYQPEKDEIVLFVFNCQTYKLIISSNAEVNRIHLTEMPTKNPKTAPSFCMLLRKHITNATIENIWQMPYERVLDFTLSGYDDLGYQNKTHLIFELTGKTSNIILTDDKYIIYDSIKHIPPDLESKRMILKGAKYTFFAPQEKIAPFDLPRIREFLSQCNAPLRKKLPETLLGVSQSTVNEFLYGIDENDHGVVNNTKILEQIAEFQTRVKQKNPNVVLRNGAPVDVCPFNFRTVKGEKIYFETLNKAHDYFYYLADKTQRFNDKAKSVSTIVKNAISRTEKKLAAQRQSVLEAQGRETFKAYGDLILSNIWNIKQGDEQLICENYFEKNQTVTIPLDRQLSPQQNAQVYYKKYRKLKSSAEHNTKLVEENQNKLQYLLTIKQNLRFCTEPEDLQEIRDELTALGLVKEQNKKKKETPIKTLMYTINGYDVYVGKNNIQNNHITFKLARQNDIWLHTQKIHSSHVLIINDSENKVPDNVILNAAEICAYYSQSSLGTKIPVDYTARKNVRRPNKAPLGFVLYNTFQTIYVNPNMHPELLKK